VRLPPIPIDSFLSVKLTNLRYVFLAANRLKVTLLPPRAYAASFCLGVKQGLFTGGEVKKDSRDVSNCS
jgi:hypothetical protein